MWLFRLMLNIEIKIEKRIGEMMKKKFESDRIKDGIKMIEVKREIDNKINKIFVFDWEFWMGIFRKWLEG